jgi:Tfp pilus assembly protein PilX
LALASRGFHSLERSLSNVSATGLAGRCSATFAPRRTLAKIIETIKRGCAVVANNSPIFTRGGTTRAGTEFAGIQASETLSFKDWI